MQSMYYVGLDVHKKTISYCVKDASPICLASFTRVLLPLGVDANDQNLL